MTIYYTEMHFPCRFHSFQSAAFPSPIISFLTLRLRQERLIYYEMRREFSFRENNSYENNTHYFGMTCRPMPPSADIIGHR